MEGKGGSVMVVLAALLQLAVGFYTVTAIGLVGMPTWAVAVLVALWVGAVALLVRLARSQPVVTPGVPVANGLLLWGLVALGGAVFSWTA